MRNSSLLLLLWISLALLAGCGDDRQGATAEELSPIQAAQACLRRAAESPPVAEKQTRNERLKPVRLTLEGPPDAEDVGILLADQRGYFAAAGLDVDVLSPVVTRNVPGYLDEGADEIGILPQPQVAMAREKGMPLVAIGSLVQRPAMAMMWLKGSGIDGFADLRGKAVAINGLSFEEALLRSLLSRAGMTLEDIQLKRVAYRLVPALLSGRADAVLGVTPNMEGVELEACGVEPVVTPLRRLGVPAYEELVVVTRSDRIAGNPRWIRAFMSALARGTAAAVEDPQAAAQAIAISRGELEVAQPQKPALAKAKVEATLPLLARSTRMSTVRAANFLEWMHGQGLIPRSLPVSEVLSNEFTAPVP